MGAYRSRRDKQFIRTAAFCTSVLLLAIVLSSGTLYFVGMQSLVRHFSPYANGPLRLLPAHNSHRSVYTQLVVRFQYWYVLIYTPSVRFYEQVLILRTCAVYPQTIYDRISHTIISHMYWHYNSIVNNTRNILYTCRCRAVALYNLNPTYFY